MDQAKERNAKMITVEVPAVLLSLGTVAVGCIIAYSRAEIVIAKGKLENPREEYDHLTSSMEGAKSSISEASKTIQALRDEAAAEIAKREEAAKHKQRDKSRAILKNQSHIISLLEGKGGEQ